MAFNLKKKRPSPSEGRGSEVSVRWLREVLRAAGPLRPGRGVFGAAQFRTAAGRAPRLDAEIRWDPAACDVVGPVGRRADGSSKSGTLHKMGGWPVGEAF